MRAFENSKEAKSTKKKHGNWTLDSNPLTMKRAEVASPSMSLSSELSDSPLLSVTHKHTSTPLKIHSTHLSFLTINFQPCDHLPFFFFFSNWTGVFFPSSSSSSSLASSLFCFSSSLSSSLSDASSIPVEGLVFESLYRQKNYRQRCHRWSNLWGRPLLCWVFPFLVLPLSCSQKKTYTA